MELIQHIKENLHSLPLSFRYLGALQQQAAGSNFNRMQYKPATIAALQTNDEPAGAMYKPVSRIINPENNFITALGDEEIDSSETVAAPAIQPDAYFKLFACCIPVKGAARSIICDLQRQFFHFIPNSLYELLTGEAKTFTEILESCGEENYATIEEYFFFLLQHEYGTWFTKDELDLFPPLQTEWKTPLPVTNCILDYDAYSTYNIEDALQQLNELGCAAVQLRFFSAQSFERLEQIADSIATARIKSLDILLPYTAAFTKNAVIDFTNRHQRLNNFFICNAPENIYINETAEGLTRIVYTTENISSETHCGIVHTNYFLVNMPLFTESLSHNNCLNKKISVDRNGLIKNCPSMQQSFGHIANTSLQQALACNGFKKLWSISKDDIEGCKDCEFRYICTDCRAYTVDENNQYSKPAKCRYNPYTAEWE